MNSSSPNERTRGITKVAKLVFPQSIESAALNYLQLFSIVDQLAIKIPLFTLLPPTAITICPPKYQNLHFEQQQQYCSKIHAVQT